MSSHQWWRPSSDVEKVSKVPSPATQIRVVSYAGSWCRKNQSFVQGIISLFVVLLVRIFVRCQNTWCWMCSWLFWVSDWDEEENVLTFSLHFNVFEMWNLKMFGMRENWRSIVAIWKFLLLFFKDLLRL